MKRSVSRLLVFILAFIAVFLPLCVIAEAALPDAQPTAAPPVTATVDLTPLIEAVILLAASLITGFLIPWIKTKYSAEKLRILSSTIRTAVYGAEEMYKSGEGDKKLEYVKNYLAAKGFKVDVTQIKAAVKKMRDEEVFTSQLEAIEANTDDDPDDDKETADI